MKVCLMSVVAALAAAGASARTIEVSTQLTEHTDWSDEELVIPSGVTLDLNGFDLAVSSVSGAGTLTDSRRYVPLDGVSSTGKQLVRVGFTPGEKSSVELDCTSGEYAGSKTYFGCVWLQYAWMFCLAENSFYFFSGGNKLAAFAANTHINFKIAADGNATLLNVDTGKVLANGSVSRTNSHTDQDFSLFGTPSGNNSSFTLHAFKLWDDGELVRDYVPARDPVTGAVGVFDRVTRALQASETATPLVAGKDAGPATSVGSLIVKSSDYPFAGFTGTVAPELRMALDSDADWTAVGEVTVSGDLDLAGHDLTVASLAGAGRIFDSRRYVPLAYTASTGKQYIKTGYVPGTSTAVELEVMPLNGVRTSAFYFGSAWATTSWTFGQTSDTASGKNPDGFFMFFGSGDNFGDYVGNCRYRLTIARSGAAQFDALEGEPRHVSKTLSLKNNGYEMCVFGGNNTRLSTSRIYGFKVWDSDVPKFDFVPARDPDTGAVGLLDRVSGRLFASETATPLVAGEDAGPARSIGSVRFVGDGRAPADFTGTIEAEAVWTLSEDADWTADGVVDLGGRTVDLNGHALKLCGLEGDGHIVDSRMIERLSYVASSDGQRVKTGVTLDAESEIEFEFTANAYVNGKVFFGSVWGANAWLFCMAANAHDFFGGGQTLGAIVPGVPLRLSVRADDKVRLVEVDSGRLIAEKSTSRTGNGKETNVFGADNRYSTYKFHAFRMWNAGKAVRDFIPARDPETLEIGLFDRIEGVLHTNETTSALTPGVLVACESRRGLEIVPTSGAPFAGFTGTLADGVRATVAGDFALTGDLDLTALGEVAINGTVNVAGYELKLASLSGCGTVVDAAVRAYDLYDCVKSTGEQRVETGFVPGEKTTVEMDFTPENSAASVYYFGSTWAYNSWSFGQTSDTGKGAYPNGFFMFFGTGNNFGDYVGNRRYLLTLADSGKMALTVRETGEVYGSAMPSLTNPNGSEMCVFAGASSQRATMSLYSFKVWDDGKLKFDFVPAKELATGKVGLLDRVSGQMFASATSTPLVGGTVTNDNPGTVTVDVAEGTAAVNRTLTLAGDLKLVKTGAGTLTVDRSGQTYARGTVLEAGTLDVMSDAASPTAYGGACGLLGVAGSKIVVGPGAVFDYDGNGAYNVYDIALAGGTLRNGGVDAPNASAGLGSMALSDDSALDMAADVAYFDTKAVTLDLAGHTYAVETGGKTLWFGSAATVTAGTLALTGGGTLGIRGKLDAKDAVLTSDGSLALTAQADVKDYTASGAGAANAGSAALNVWGTFRPLSDGFYGCTLQDGAVLDLSAREGTWSTASAATGGRTEVTFAKGATVTLDFGARAIDGKVLSWTTPPDGVAFEIRGAAADAGRRLSIRADGLYAADGLMIQYK